MLSKVAFSSALVFIAVQGVLADPVPNTPGPNDVYNTGAACPIMWGVDPTGTWKTMNIELMTGDNFNMKHITTVATVDGTDPSKNSYSWTCPDVTPNSAIYFYQFTSPASTNYTWTTRFAIASTSGQTTPPENANQPGAGGAAIPWGTGALVDPSTGTPPPSDSPMGSGSNGASTNSSSSAVTPVSSPSTTPTTSLVMVTTTSSSSTAPTSSLSNSTMNGTKGNGAGSLTVSSRVTQAAVALSVAAVGFAALL